MTKNIGGLDAAIRTVIGIALVAAAGSLLSRPFLAVAAVLVALVMLGTALTRVCPLYVLLGLNTCPRDLKPSRPPPL